MNAKGKSPKNSTRQANKILRRNRILNIAKHLIASEGLEAFTLSQLADKASVICSDDPQLIWQKK